MLLGGYDPTESILGSSLPGSTRLRGRSRFGAAKARQSMLNRNSADPPDFLGGRTAAWTTGSSPVVTT